MCSREVSSRCSDSPCSLDKAVEDFRIPDSEIGENLAVQINLGLFESMDELDIISKGFVGSNVGLFNLNEYDGNYLTNFDEESARREVEKKHSRDIKLYMTKEGKYMRV